MGCSHAFSVCSTLFHILSRIVWGVGRHTFPGPFVNKPSYRDVKQEDRTCQKKGTWRTRSSRRPQIRQSAGEEKTFTQEEVNKIVEKRLNRERQKFASVLNQDDPREAALAERERAVMARELRIDATETFLKEGLPAELLDLLNYTDKESCEQSIELVRHTYMANVNAAVERRLMGGKPPRRPPQEEPADALRGAFGL